MPEVKFAVCPGRVKSINDGEWHFIGIGALVRLYELEPGEYVVYGRHRGYDPPLRLLYPRHDGNYGRPE